MGSLSDGVVHDTWLSRALDAETNLTTAGPPSDQGLHRGQNPLDWQTFFLSSSSFASEASPSASSTRHSPASHDAGPPGRASAAEPRPAPAASSSPLLSSSGLQVGLAPSHKTLLEYGPSTWKQLPLYKTAQLQPRLDNQQEERQAAMELDISYDRVSNWFQNRRGKSKSRLQNRVHRSVQGLRLEPQDDDRYPLGYAPALTSIALAPAQHFGTAHDAYPIAPHHQVLLSDAVPSPSSVPPLSASFTLNSYDEPFWGASPPVTPFPGNQTQRSGWSSNLMGSYQQDDTLHHPIPQSAPANITRFPTDRSPQLSANPATPNATQLCFSTPVPSNDSYDEALWMGSPSATPFPAHEAEATDWQSNMMGSYLSESVLYHPNPQSAPAHITDFPVDQSPLSAHSTTSSATQLYFPTTVPSQNHHHQLPQQEQQLEQQLQQQQQEQQLQQQQQEQLQLQQQQEQQQQLQQQQQHLAHQSYPLYFASHDHLPGMIESDIPLIHHNLHQYNRQPRLVRAAPTGTRSISVPSNMGQFTFPVAPLNPPQKELEVVIVDFPTPATKPLDLLQGKGPIDWTFQNAGPKDFIKNEI